MAKRHRPEEIITKLRQDAVYGGDAESGAEPRAMTPLVQPAGQRLHAERSRDAIADAVKAEDEANRFSLDRIDDEAFLEPGAARFASLGGEAEVHTRTIVEALPCVVLHGAQHVLGVLAALSLIKGSDD